MMDISISELINTIKPYVLSWIGGVGGGAGPYAPSPHDLQSGHHTGSVSDSQGPQFLKTDGTRTLTGNMSVSVGATIDGVDISALAAAPFLALGTDANLSGERQFAPGNGLAGTDGGANGTYALVVDLAATSGLSFSTGKLQLDDSVAGAGIGIASKVLSITAGNGISVAADGVAVSLSATSGLQFSSGTLQIDDAIAGAGLTIASKVLAVGAGNGITVNANDVALTTPGTLTVSTTNSASGSHTHAITSSSTPGAAASLLATDASGNITIQNLTLAGTTGLTFTGSASGLNFNHNSTHVIQSSTGTLQIAAHTLTGTVTGNTQTISGLGLLSVDNVQIDLNTVSATGGGDLIVSGGAAGVQLSGATNITLNPTGSVVFDPAGNNVNPNTNYDLNLGLINKKWLTVHAAELWVETLVAQDTVSTIGGRVIVAPTTSLIADLPSASGSIASSALTSGSAAAASSAATASVTPTASRLVLLAVTSVAASTPNAPTVTGNSLTWVQVGTVTFNTVASGLSRLTVFRALGAAPTTGTATIDFAAQSQTQIVWSMIEFSGVSTEGTNGSGAIQQYTTTRGDAQTTLTGTLGGFYNTLNATYAAIALDTNNAVTPEGSWSEIHDLGATGIRLETEFIASNDTSPSATWSSADAALLAIEIVCSGGTTIDVKHNQMQSGDRVLMQAQGKIEWMAITSAASTITGGYRYSVTRNLDGTGDSDWYAGDAVVNTGTTGSGFIDLYSLESVNGRPVDYAYNFNNTGSAFSANYASSSAWTMFGDSANTEVNDAMYFGMVGAAWTSLFYNIGTAAVYTATLVWEFWNGAAWTSFSPTTTDFKSTGHQSTVWTIGSLTGWVPTVVNSIEAYWVRVRISAFTSFATQPTQTVRRVYHEKSQFGPTIVGWVRGSSTYNDVTENWAIGNLNGLYGYGTDTYGVGLGKYAASSATYLTIDATNGYRVMNGTTVIGQWDMAGAITVGEVSASHGNVQISSGAIDLRVNTTSHVNISTAGALRVGQIANSTARVEIDTTNGMRMISRSAGGSDTTVIQFDTSGNADITGKLRMAGASSAIAIGTTPPTSATAGTGLWLDRNGVTAVSANNFAARMDSGGVTIGSGDWQALRFASSTGSTLFNIRSWYVGPTFPDLTYIDGYSATSGSTGHVMLITANGGTPVTLNIDSSWGAIYTSGSFYGGLVRGWDMNTSPAHGYVQLNSGDATHAGYIGFHSNAGTRLGYIGYDNTDVGFVMEGTAKFKITGSITNSTALAVRTYNSAAFNHNSTGNYLAVTFDTDRLDPDDMHSVATNTSRLTCQHAGVFLITGHLRFASNATGYRFIAVRLNGATFIANHGDTAMNGIAHSMSIATIYNLSAGDYVELMGYQSSGGNLNIEATGNYSPEFGMARIA